MHVLAQREREKYAKKHRGAGGPFGFLPGVHDRLHASVAASNADDRVVNKGLVLMALSQDRKFGICCNFKFHREMIVAVRIDITSA
jgi:hypothetical protein